MLGCPTSQSWREVCQKSRTRVMEIQKNWHFWASAMILAGCIEVMFRRPPGYPTLQCVLGEWE